MNRFIRERSLSIDREGEKEEQVSLVDDFHETIRSMDQVSPSPLRRPSQIVQSQIPTTIHESKSNSPAGKSGNNEKLDIHINRRVINNASLYIDFGENSKNEYGGVLDGNNFRSIQSGSSHSVESSSSSFINRIKNLKESCCPSSPSSSNNKSCCSPLSLLYSIFPILYWLPRYKWKSDLVNDIIAGFTVAVMHIPQGMAYSALANVPPIVGIYMAFFPVIIYSIMGTSRHISMGTFAVICLMAGQVVFELSDVDPNLNKTIHLHPYLIPNGTLREGEIEKKHKYSSIEVATILSLVVGLWQFLLGFLRLGFLSVLLSADLVSGFTTGAAFHVFTSQVKGLLGLSLTRRNGFFKIILTYADIFEKIKETNLTAVIVSGITITVLLIFNEIIKPWLAKKTKIPIPIELLTIVAGTLVSKYWDMASKFDVDIIEKVPTGLPPPKVPPIDLFQDVLVDGLIIAIVAYVISISMAKIFALKYNYTIDANQELIANGASNLVGSFFSCAPISASLSRSVIQDVVGGKTQIAGLFSCSILIFVLLWIGPFFEPLPNCVLASIIVVALKGMFMQVYDFPKTLKESWLNGFVWLMTFISTIVLDIEYGLMVGLGLSILTLILRSNRPKVSILAPLSNTGLYTEINDSKSQSSKEVIGLKIIKYTGSINFASAEYFANKIIEIVPIKKQSSSSSSSSSPASLSNRDTASINNSENGGSEDIICTVSKNSYKLDYVDWIIFDFSSLSSLDPAGAKKIRMLYNQYGKADVKIVFAAVQPSVLEIFEKCDNNFLKEIGLDKFYPSLHDAFTFCSGRINSYNNSISNSNTITNRRLGVKNEISHLNTNLSDFHLNLSKDQSATTSNNIYFN